MVTLDSQIFTDIMENYEEDKTHSWLLRKRKTYSEEVHRSKDIPKTINKTAATAKL